MFILLARSAGFYSLVCLAKFQSFFLVLHLKILRCHKLLTDLASHWSWCWLIRCLLTHQASRQIDISDRNPPITAISVTFRPIGGFRSDLSITCMIDGNLETFPRVFCFPKSRINENDGKPRITPRPLLRLNLRDALWSLSQVIN